MHSASEDNVAIRVAGLRTRIGETEILRGIDLEIHRGEVFAVLGSSGSGKSTFLRAINYLTPFTAGSIRIGDVQLRPGLCERNDSALLRSVRKRVGMVFQSFHLFPHLTALENITEAPQRVLGLAARDAERRAMALLERVGLAERARAYPHELSGGQQQRVAIARALAMEPEVLLFDEPISALDPRLAGEVLAVIRSLAEGGQTMVIVTHLVHFVHNVAHRVAVLSAGRIADCGAPADVLDRPRCDATRHLLNF